MRVSFMKALTRCSFVLFTAAFLSPIIPAAAETYLIEPDGSGDFPTIQEAIDAVVDGDVIELADGVFTGEGNRDLDLLGRAITIRSRSGDPESCIINCEGSESEPHRGLIFQSGEGAGTVLEGLTITGGHAAGEDPQDRGGGILLLGHSSPAIRKAVFRANSAAGGGGAACLGSDTSPAFVECVFESNAAGVGGGLYCRGASPSLSTCAFIGNTAIGSGGGISSSTSQWILEYCTFIENVAETAGALLSVWESGTMSHCTIVSNTAEYGGALYFDLAGQRTIMNTIMVENQGGSAFDGHCSGAAFLCCDIYGNPGGDWVGCIADQLGMNGNLSDDPLFCDSENDDFSLRENSLCAPENNPECGLIGAWPVGCEGPTAIAPATWGRIKARRE
jgi:predicted outer membrane repeat protein